MSTFAWSGATPESLLAQGAVQVEIPIWHGPFDPYRPPPPDAVRIHEAGREPRLCGPDTPEYTEVWRAMRRRWGWIENPSGHRGKT